ncbi:MAG TPA: glycerophosphodiester phosphodiesterase [Calditrichia bacterium]|nr:glycerophosphodiester phosphodiesterase [Calditrichia bacterium]
MSGMHEPMIVAHRGEKILAPENTVKAAHLALSQGANALEVDVRICGSGEIVVMHDALLKRHFGINRPVAATPLSELKALQFDQASYRYQDRICSLDEFLEEFGGKVMINLDAKSLLPTCRRFSRQLADVILRHGIGEKLWVSSFNPFVIRYIKSYRPEVRTGFLFQDPLHAYRFIDVFLDSDAWHPHFLNVTDWFVNEARRKNKQLFAWTVNDAGVFHRMRHFRFDGIISDVFFRKHPLHPEITG